MYRPRTLSISQQIELKKQDTPQNVVIPSRQQNTPERVLGKHAINTHFFDGQLPLFTSSINDKHVAQGINNDILRAAQVSKEDKTECFQKLGEKVRDYSLLKNGAIPAHSLKYLRLIISTHEKHGRIASPGNGNYDSANKLHACDLLYLLYEKIMNEEEPEHMRLMLEQLDEMSTGPCPAGRVTRLFQALIMLRTDLTPTSNYID